MDASIVNEAGGILKRNYEGKIVNQVANPSALWATIDKNSRSIVQGEKTIVALRMNLSQAVGARSEFGVLPIAQKTRTVQKEVTLKNLYGVMRISGPLMEASKTDSAAFIRAIRNESEGMTESLKIDMARQSMGDGTGNLAQLAVNVATQVLQLESDANMLYFEVDMRIDIRNSTTKALISSGDSRTITDVDVANKQITIDAGGGNVTTAVTDAVYREDSVDEEVGGLKKIISATGILHGVDPTVPGNRRWASTEDLAFGTFDEIKFQNSMDDVHTQSGAWPNMIYSQKGPRNAYLRTLKADRRFVTQNPIKLDAGFKGLAYTGGEREAAWVKDSFVRGSEEVFAPNMDWLELRRAKPFKFITIGGSVWIAEIAGSQGVDAFKAVLASYMEMVTRKRNAHLHLDGVV